MLASIRKFSSSIYAKIFLIIVAIPFVFWGMGPLFTGGNVNIVVVIDKEKYSTQDFVNYIQNFVSTNQKINVNQIEELLSLFIGDLLLEKEIEYFSIKLSDNSLSKLIKHQKGFKRKNEFSRIEYENFLLKNNITAAFFQTNLSKSEKKKQLLDFVGGGILPSKFLVNSAYDKINQKRNIQLINLNDLFEKEFNFSNEEINSYYESKKDNFNQIYKSIKLLELNPKTLTGSDDYNDSFFRKIDEIDDSIMSEENFDSITQKFNLGKANSFTLNKSGEDINSKKIKSLPEILIKNIFAITEDEPTVLFQIEDKYFIVQVVKTESIEKNLKNEGVRKEILLNLQMNKKKKIISNIISRINQKNFNKSDFDKMSKDKNLSIKKINLENKNDSKILKTELLNQIYSFPEKKIIVVHDLNLVESYLIYIDKITNVTINKNSNEYEKYFNLSKSKITSRLFNTYDHYIKMKYKIDINYKALDTVKNYFN